jgi:hypothetical protein
LLTETVAICVWPTATSPNEIELGSTVSGSVLKVIPQPVVNSRNAQVLNSEAMAKVRAAKVFLRWPDATGRP